MSTIALVTGGTRGIGAAISKALKDDGFGVAAVYRGDDAAAERFEAETSIRTFKWDVAEEAACRDGVAQVEAELGPVSILVNNAGITRDGVFHKMGWEQWRAVLATNLDSMFTMTRAVIEGMRERRFGRVINLSSINGQKGQFGQVNYSAAKAGVIGFTKALAQENASRGVTVNAVCPGYIAPTWSPRCLTTSGARLWRRFPWVGWERPRRSRGRFPTSRHRRPDSARVPS